MTEKDPWAEFIPTSTPPSASASSDPYAAYTAPGLTTPAAAAPPPDTYRAAALAEREKLRKQREKEERRKRREDRDRPTA